MSDQEKTKIFSISGLPPGTQLNGLYEVDEKIAAGGMGEVFRGHEIMGGHPVAIKVVLQEFAPRRNHIRSVPPRDAGLAGPQSSGNRALHDVGRRSGRRAPLSRHGVRRRSVFGQVAGDRTASLSRRADHVRSMADGLHAAHQLGIIHRDISADNVILAAARLQTPRSSTSALRVLRRTKRFWRENLLGSTTLYPPSSSGFSAVE